MADTVHVKGLADLQRLLDTLPAKIERNVLRGALRAGANVLMPIAAANIRSRSGETARSLKVRSDARGGRVTGSVYTKYFVARFLEYGTKAHLIHAANRQALSFGGGIYEFVRHPGARPRPFLRPALDTHGQSAVVAVGEYMKRRLLLKEGLDTADILLEPQ